MKVLLITSAYPSDAEDPRGTFIHRLARALASAGAQVTVLAPGTPSGAADEVRDGVIIRRAQYWIKGWQRLAVGLGGIVPNLRSRPWLLVQVPSLVAALCWKAMRMAGEYDVVHSHWVYPSGIAGLLAARRHGLPLVVTSHGGDLNLARRSMVLWKLSGKVCRAANVCIGVSEALVEDLRQMGVSEDRATFVPLGVERLAGQLTSELEQDPDFRQFREFEGFRIVYVGSLIVRKSVATLVEACEILRRRGHQVACALVGSGPTESSLRAMVRDKSLENFVFLGFQQPAVAQAWMTAGDVCVLPSLSEGRPVVIMEAMANGVPVIASDIPGNRELVRHGETGVLFPARDSLALADAIESLIVDQAGRGEMGRRGRAVVEEQGLEVSAVAERHLDLYRRLTQEEPVEAYRG